MNPEPVIDNAPASRYEMRIANQICFIDYRRRIATPHNIVNMTHAEVPVALRGRKLGEQLVKGALELVRQHDERVIPSCPFVVAYIRRHAEYQALLAE